MLCKYKALESKILEANCNFLKLTRLDENNEIMEVSFIIDFTDKIQKKRGILQDYHKFIQEVRKAVLEII